ncbi:hypothetical protein PTKIN_Ptkin03bG0135600 [Pterospermum kingtungense]
MLWDNKNKCFHHDSVSPTPIALLNAVSGFKEDFLVNVAEHETEMFHSDLSWKAPPSGVLKVNVDAAFSVHTKKVSLGMVIRDSMGMVAVSGAVKHKEVSSSLQYLNLGRTIRLLNGLG